MKKNKEESSVPHISSDQLACMEHFGNNQLSGWMDKHKDLIVAIYAEDTHRVFQIKGFYFDKEHDYDVIYVAPFDSLPSLIPVESAVGKCLKHGQYKVVTQ